MRKQLRTVQLHFYVSESEADLIKKQMEEIGVTNLSAYLRKMTLNGYVIYIDISELREMVRLLRICSNNLNQYARKANQSGSIYAADIQDLYLRFDDFWEMANALLSGVANVS